MSERDRDRGTAEGVPPTAGEDDDRGRRPRPRGSGRRRVRVPRTERFGQDDDDSLLARARTTDGGHVDDLGTRRHRAGCGKVMPRVGAIVETPALFPTMTGRENLRLLGAIDRIPARARRLDARSSSVSPNAATTRCASYSLGMRQRLGLAAALLKDPALLVLDEPANGLDPAGIRQIRELLRRLGAEGRTVFVSSHLLSEIEHTCDSVAIIDRGKLVLEGRVDDVLAAAAAPSLLVGLADLEAGAACATGGRARGGARGVVVARPGPARRGRRRDEAARRPRLVRHGAAARRGHARGAVPRDDDPRADRRGGGREAPALERSSRCGARCTAASCGGWSCSRAQAARSRV